MNWLSQNWVWVVLAIGAAFYFFRGRAGGHGGGHGHGPGGLLGGMGHGGDGGVEERNKQPDRQTAVDAPELAVDPVGGEAVRTAQALTSVYQGKIYYFASKENRDRFEVTPQEYAHKVAGDPVVSAEAPHDRPRRRRGC